ncbi:MAG TPA: AI-2E family transporter [Jatrophihabitans sp.]|nr:AI-2E family transporter [Jatrophihabitans sp.]
MTDPLGRPGPPVSRGPFHRGFVGGLGALAAVAIALALREAQSALVLVLIAGFLALGLDPLVNLLDHRGIRRGRTVAGVAVALVVLLGAVVFVIGDAVRVQVERFVDDAPHLVQELRRNRTIAHLDAKYHVLNQVQHKLSSAELGKTAVGGLFDVSLSVINALVSVVVVFVLTVYFLADLPRIKRVLYSLAPASRRARVSKIGDEITRRVGGYVVGAALTALIAATVTFILLLAVGLGEFALPLALAVALLDLVPLVGSVIGAALVTLVGFATSLPVGVACLITYLIYEPIEGYVIYPRFMRSSVQVPEYVTIMAVLVGGTVGGIVGALLALPVAASLLLLVQEVWVRRQDVS